ncbi:MAG: hypothetical protein LKE40_09775 [Spirochaetia bacterium]|nr:hypothetical protein [Spirochaetia bacterium]
MIPDQYDVVTYDVHAAIYLAMDFLMEKTLLRLYFSTARIPVTSQGIIGNQLR